MAADARVAVVGTAAVGRAAGMAAITIAEAVSGRALAPA
jgi:hypothetical protein